MSQSNMNVGNVSAPQFRSDMNAALQALASTSSGSAAPSTTYANQLWYDTTANILKMRNEANSTWINLLYIEQTGAVRVLDDTQVVSTSGVQTGLLGDQTTATWEAGTGTVESLVSPAKIKAAIDALAGTPGYTSALTVVAASTTYTLAHGLGSIPRRLEARLVCNTSEAGFSVNDEIALATFQDSTTNGVGIWTNATNVVVRFAANYAVHAGAGYAVLNLSNWRLRVRAWK